MTEYSLVYIFINVWITEILFPVIFYLKYCGRDATVRPCLYDIKNSNIDIQISFHILVATDSKDDNVALDSTRINLHNIVRNLK